MSYDPNPGPVPQPTEPPSPTPPPSIESTPVPIYVPTAQRAENTQVRATTATQPPGTNVWLMWVGLTAAGAAVAALINYFIGYVVGDQIIRSFVRGVITGALVGLGQWAVLRRFFPTMPAWVWPLATAGGILIGYVAYYVLPVTRAGFAGVVGCLSAATLFLVMLPLNSVAKRMENKRILAVIAAFVIGLISLGLDRWVISPAVEQGLSGSQNISSVAESIGVAQILAGLMGVGQWLALRLYVRKVEWWKWALAAAFGGTFGGFVRGLLLLIIEPRNLSLFTDILFSVIVYGFIAVATGWVLVRVVPEPTPLMPASATPHA